MPQKFKIHPAIGIARLGDSDEFYLAPEEAGGLPIECDKDGNAALSKAGNEQPIVKFKDSQKRVKKQAARFRVFVYDGGSPQGRELKTGEIFQVVLQKTGQLIEAELVDIEWTVYLANKKSSWYQFQQLDGEHGYAPDHPLRNADLTDPEARQKLIIDPGPQSVNYADPQNRRAEFRKGNNPGYAQSFPPPLKPNSIDTLGEIKATQQNNYNRLIVLGGNGNSGSYKSGFEDPIIRHYANNEGWFDDTSDGPVTAQLKYKILSIDGRKVDAKAPTQFGTVAVDAPAWVIVGYPAYAPQIIDMITMDDVLYDVAIRNFAYDTYLYGQEPFDGSQPPPKTADELAVWRETSQWNPNYYP